MLWILCQFPPFTGVTELEAATMADRQEAILNALDGQRSQRTLLSPAEALNVITVGAWYEDAVGGFNGSSVVYEPYEQTGPNISSAMGLGIGKLSNQTFSCREAGSCSASPAPVDRWVFVVRSRAGSMAWKAAIPDAGGRLDQEGLTAGPVLPRPSRREPHTASLTHCRMRTTAEYSPMSIRCTTASW